MKDDDLSGDEKNRQYIAHLAEEQLAGLETASDLVDRKAGTLLGFVAVIISLSLGIGFPASSSYLDKVFVYAAFLLLFAALVCLILSISPKVKRYDPNPIALMERYWTQDYEKTMGTVASNMVQAWEKNKGVHDKKAEWYGRALLPTVLGLSLLAFDVLVIRVFGGG
ncbi:MAG: hypothetical protein KAU10_02950 [Dehalococcoidia bacterium]|nr:hypothetical protein [Dehalococcoidia bacterium]